MLRSEGMKAFDRSWAGATWQGARDNARRAAASMTLADKLAWLESAEQLALSLRKQGASGNETTHPGCQPRTREESR